MESSSRPESRYPSFPLELIVPSSNVSWKAERIKFSSSDVEFSLLRCNRFFKRIYRVRGEHNSQWVYRRTFALSVVTVDSGTKAITLGRKYHKTLSRMLRPTRFSIPRVISTPWKKKKFRDGAQSQWLDVTRRAMTILLGHISTYEMH